MGIRTDLAVEAKELYEASAGDITKLSGVRARKFTVRGISRTVVEVLNAEGAKALGKPVGTYVTIELERRLLREPEGFQKAAEQLGKTIKEMVPQNGTVLVAGLGNLLITPDALGPRCLEHLLVTRHLTRLFPQMRAVGALAPGVLGTTGLESAEVVRGVVERSGAACVVVVDALVSRRPERICTTIQLSDSGIVPGSGVGNSRAAFTQESLGVPVLALGVPTVVTAETLLRDALEQHGHPTSRQMTSALYGMVVMPKDMDARIAQMARLLGYGLSLGLHTGMRLDDILCLLS